jgi:flavin reductase (DIM6/NTAB) family NADH-FMN oxidoreductase RutF
MTGPGRVAVRRLASGVTVLTVAHRDTAHGTTVSAVSAVSRDPLLVCACLRSGSVFAELAGRSRRFVVNVLSRRQAPLADWFARPDRPTGTRQFDGVDWEPEPETGTPLLRHTLGWLGCRLTGCVPAGDHDILLAEVVAGGARTGSPLLNFDGRLHGTDLYEVIRRTDRPHPAAAATTTLD